jgi:outer membrane lipoprotein
MEKPMPFSPSLFPIRRLALAACLLLLTQLAGCASALSRETMQQVSPNVSARDVLDHPERFIGQTILVAGHVLRTENRKEGTLLEILGYPTTSRAYPDTSEPALGRFMLLHPGYLDALIFQPGRQVVAAGRIIGQRPVTIGETVHPEPLLQSVELKLLPEYPTYYSPIHVGFGLMFGF